MKILSSGLLVATMSLPAISNPSPRSCTDGFYQHQNREFLLSTRSFKICIETLKSGNITAGARNLVWAYYFTARSYYELNRFEEARHYAILVMDIIKRTTNPLRQGDIAFLKHIINDVKEEVTITSVSTDADFGLSVNKSASKDLEKVAASRQDAKESEGETVDECEGKALACAAATNGIGIESMYGPLEIMYSLDPDSKQALPDLSANPFESSK